MTNDAASRDDSRMLCYCKSVNYGEVRQAIEETDAKTVATVTAHNQAGGGCRTCHNEIEELIAVHRENKKKSRGILGRLFGWLGRTS